MNEELIKEVFSDEEYVKSLFESESWEAAQASLKEKGIDMTIDQLKQMIDILKNNTTGELSEDDLETVTGGVTQIVAFTVSLVVAITANVGIAFGKEKS